MAHDKTLGLAPTMISNLIERWDGFGDASHLAGSGGGELSRADTDYVPAPPPKTFAAEDVDSDPEGVLSQNRRNFRHPSSSPATSASRSIILPSLWKV